MQQWIESLLQYTSNEFILIDNEGYFLIHPNKQWEWSRYQNPPKKAAEYFGLSSSELNYFRDKEYRWINNDTVAFPLDLFGQKLLALYRPHVSLQKIFFQKNLQFALIVLTSLALIVAPFMMMIRLYIRRIGEEKVKIKEGKTYLATLFNSVFDAVIVTDSLGVIQRINYQALRLFGYTQEELIGKNVNILIPEPYHSLHNGYIRDYVSRGEDQPQLQTGAYNGDGKQIHQYQDYQ